MKQKIFLSIFLILSLGLMFSFVSAQGDETTPNIGLEQVKCVFENSDEIQKCYTGDGKFGCSGTGTCVADVKGKKGDKQTWKSSCGGYDYTLIDGNNDYAEFRCPKTLEPKSIVTEKVKCVFENSNEIQKCSTDDGKFGCSGTGTCVVDVKGEKGTKQTWKSSCKGDAYTIIDGDNDYAEFKCPKTLKSKPIVKEQVKCVFENSNEIQKCSTGDGIGCSGVGTCVADVKGEKGTKQIWKSSCGGYDYTIIDGESDYAEFKCISELKVTEKIIGGKGFRYAYWQCYDKDEEKQGSESSCKLSRTWKKYATEFCQEKCNEDNSKCGVNSFSITGECYLDFGEKEVVFVSSIEEEEKKQEKKIIEEEKEEILICKDSCPSDGKCYPFGYRKSEKFCSDTGSFIKQSKEKVGCENNFECSSNLCIDSQCISQGLFKKIMNWFSKLFG